MARVLNSDANHVDISGVSVSAIRDRQGERGLRLEAAERTSERLRAELDEARWEVHRDVHAAFHRALVARERLAAAERLLTFQERLLEIARGRLRAGDVSPLPVRLAEGELSQARVARIAAEQGYLRARLQLGALAGWPAAHPPEPAGNLDEPRDPPGTSALIEVARSHQPRLRTLQAAQVEATAQSRAADRDAWPEPSLGVQVMREGFPAGPPETQVLGVVSVPIPLFQRNQGARATAQAQSRIADAERQAFGSQLLNFIEQHRTALWPQQLLKSEPTAAILPTFEENLRLIQRAFELGGIDILQVSVARERFRAFKPMPSTPTPTTSKRWQTSKRRSARTCGPTNDTSRPRTPRPRERTNHEKPTHLGDRSALRIPIDDRMQGEQVSGRP
ncbi:MAG: TolC family protein [Deltaproteobacteria bacterium]|nr:TolC family protein [Deltaproteobacteria bacterium]